jgi:hypothetical protein
MWPLFWHETKRCSHEGVMSTASTASHLSLYPMLLLLSPHLICLFVRCFCFCHLILSVSSSDAFAFVTSSYLSLRLMLLLLSWNVVFNTCLLMHVNYRICCGGKIRAVLRFSKMNNYKNTIHKPNFRMNSKNFATLKYYPIYIYIDQGASEIVGWRLLFTAVSTWNILQFFSFFWWRS